MGGGGGPAGGAGPTRFLLLVSGRQAPPAAFGLLAARAKHDGCRVAIVPSLRRLRGKEMAEAARACGLGVDLRGVSKLVKMGGDFSTLLAHRCVTLGRSHIAYFLRTDGRPYRFQCNGFALAAMDLCREMGIPVVHWDLAGLSGVEERYAFWECRHHAQARQDDLARALRPPS